MLVLTRKVNQSVLIGHKIVVQVVETGGRVRLGISAPHSVRVVRAEFGATTERDHECPCCGFVEDRPDFMRLGFTSDELHEIVEGLTELGYGEIEHFEGIILQLVRDVKEARRGKE